MEVTILGFYPYPIGSAMHEGWPTWFRSIVTTAGGATKFVCANIPDADYQSHRRVEKAKEVAVAVLNGDRSCFEKWPKFCPVDEARRKIGVGAWEYYHTDEGEWKDCVPEGWAGEEGARLAAEAPP